MATLTKIMSKRNFSTERKVVFAAMSKRNFFLREHIIRFILNRGFTPTCAFMMYSYFLLDTVDRRKLIRANNDLIRRSDELWVFGDISNGVKKEIELADEVDLPVKYFAIGSSTSEFLEVRSQKDLVFEK